MRDDDVRSPGPSSRAEARGAVEMTAAPARAEKPIDGGECAARVGHAPAPLLDARAAPVLDETLMSKFVALMGPDWVAKGLRKFAIDVEGRLASLDAATPSDLAAITHGMITMTAHCGFTELYNLSVDVQREARQGAGLNRVAELRAAGERALAVMRSYTPRP
jgi:hypothetical protein